MKNRILAGLAVLSMSIGLAVMQLAAAVVTYGPNKEILVDGRPFFPIMQFAQDNAQLDMNTSIGVNTFFGMSGTTALNAYRTKNVWGIVNYNASLRTHTALLSWSFGDEPDGNGTPASQILSQYTAIKTADPSHLAFLTLTANFATQGGSEYYDYCAATDAVGFDYYPVYGWCRPDLIYRVGDFQKTLAVTYGRGLHPTYQWISACKCSGEFCSLRGEYPWEIRCQVWLAIVNGANAIGYFTHTWRDSSCVLNPSGWYAFNLLTDSQKVEMTRTNRQVTALAPVLCQPVSAVNVTKLITSGGGRLDLLAKEYDSRLFIIAVNVLNASGTNNNKTVTITVPNLSTWGGLVNVDEESRTITPSGNTFTDTFNDREPVHIYVLGAGTGLLEAYRPPLPGDNSIPAAPESRSTPQPSGSLTLSSPNPMPDRAEFIYTALRQERVTIRIIGQDGSVRRTLLDSVTGPGRQVVTWDRDKTTGPGIYYCVARSPYGRQTIRLLVLK